MRLLKHNFLWIIFFGFAVFAVWTREDPYVFISQGQYGLGKPIVWAIFLGFLGYSIYSGTQENFFKSLRSMTKLFWGWQIGLDLYIGLILPFIIIYLHGGILVFLIWLIPVLFYANLATLLYLALNYDSLISQFMV